MVKTLLSCASTFVPGGPADLDAAVRRALEMSAIFDVERRSATPAASAAPRRLHLLPLLRRQWLLLQREVLATRLFSLYWPNFQTS